MSEEELKQEIQLLEKKIKFIEDKIEPLKKIQREILAEMKKQITNARVSVKIVSGKVQNGENNIKRWKADLVIYNRVLHNIKSNTQMFESEF